MAVQHFRDDSYLSLLDQIYKDISDQELLTTTAVLKKMFDNLNNPAENTHKIGGNNDKNNFKPGKTI